MFLFKPILVLADCVLKLLYEGCHVAHSWKLRLKVGVQSWLGDYWIVMLVSLLVELVQQCKEWMGIVRCSLPAVPASITCTSISTSLISRFSATGSTWAICTWVTAIVLTWVSSLEWIEQLILVVDKLVKLVLVKIVGRVEAIVAAITLTSFDNIWTADKDNRNKLEWRVDREVVVFGAMFIQLRQASVVDEWLGVVQGKHLGSFSLLIFFNLYSILAHSRRVSVLLF